MKIETLSKTRAANELNEWLKNTNSLPSISNDYNDLRESLQKKYNNLKNQEWNNARHGYFIDIHFGVFLYNQLNEIDWMSLRVAANDEFWAYLSVKVVPDIVLNRYKSLNENKESKSRLEDRFYKAPARIWLKTLWWFINIAWQGDSKTTIDLLKKPVFTSDEMVCITERPGKNGMFISLYREILKYYSNLDKEVLESYKKYLRKGNSDTLMRAVIRLHTAKATVMDPCLYEGGIEGYVDDLFNEFIKKIKKLTDGKSITTKYTN